MISKEELHAIRERSDKATFIANSRTDIPALLDEVERLQDVNRNLCNMIDRRNLWVEQLEKQRDHITGLMATADLSKPIELQVSCEDEGLRKENAKLRELLSVAETDEVKNRPIIEIGHGFTGKGPFPIIIFTMIDYHKEEGAFKMFKTKHDLEAWAARK